MIRFLALFNLPLLLAACGESDAGARGGADTVLRFTAIPDQNTTELQQKYDPVAEYPSAKLGVPVEYTPAADYQASVDMFKNGDVHLAWFGGLTGLQARQAVPGARAIVQGVEDPTFVSYFIAHASTGIEESDAFPMGMAGKSFTFGSESSTSGRLMPEHYIRENTNQAPAEFFDGQPGFSGSHDKTCALVESGEVQCGAVNYRVYIELVAEQKIDPAVCKVIWHTPEYSDYNFTAHPAIDEMFGAGTIDKLRTALTRMTDENLLLAFQRTGLIAASDEDFEPLATVARALGKLR